MKRVEFQDSNSGEFPFEQADTGRKTKRKFRHFNEKQRVRLENSREQKAFRKK